MHNICYVDVIRSLCGGNSTSCRRFVLASWVSISLCIEMRTSRVQRMERYSTSWCCCTVCITVDYRYIVIKWVSTKLDSEWQFEVFIADFPKLRQFNIAIWIADLPNFVSLAASRCYDQYVEKRFSEQQANNARRPKTENLVSCLV